MYNDNDDDEEDYLMRTNDGFLMTLIGVWKEECIDSMYYSYDSIIFVWIGYAHFVLFITPPVSGTILCTSI